MRSYFADGCDHEIFEPNINSCFRKVAHMQMAKAVTQKALCVCGYHVYKDIWKVAVGETVVCVLEPDNFYEKNTVVVEKDGRIIGHLPWKVITLSCSFSEDTCRWNHSLHCDWKMPDGRQHCYSKSR